MDRLCPDNSEKVWQLYVDLMLLTLWVWGQNYPLLLTYYVVRWVGLVLTFIKRLVCKFEGIWYDIVKNLRTRPTHLTTDWVNIKGLFNRTHTNRVNELMTTNIRSTYNCHTFLEFDHLTIFRVNIWGYFVIKLLVEVKVVPNLNRA